MYMRGSLFNLFNLIICMLIDNSLINKLLRNFDCLLLFLL